VNKILVFGRFCPRTAKPYYTGSVVFN